MKVTYLIITVCFIALGTNRSDAADATIPIMLVGDWCYASEEGKRTDYVLPSWTEGGICKKILSVNPWSFYSEGWSCHPVQIKQKKDCAPSGCAYIASVVALCQRDGPVNSGTRKLFEMSRYKGNFSLTEK